MSMLPTFLRRLATLPQSLLPCLALACLTNLAASPASAGETILLCHESADVRPWRMLDGSGLNFDILRGVEKRLDISIQVKTLPWKRCLAQLKANEVSGAFAASFKPDRMDAGVYPGEARAPDVSKRLHVDRYVLLRRKGGAVEWDGKRLRHGDLPVGIQLGYSIGDNLREMGVPVDDGSQLVPELATKLQVGRISAAAMLEGEASVLMTARPDLARDLEVLPIPLAEKPYYLMLSHAFVRSNPELAQKIWKAIEEVRNSPAYRKRERAALEAMKRQP